MVLVERSSATDAFEPEESVRAHSGPQIDLACESQDIVVSALCLGFRGLQERLTHCRDIAWRSRGVSHSFLGISPLARM